MSKFFVNKSGKGSDKEFVFKVNGFNDNKTEHRLGKIHFDLSQYIGQIDETIRVNLTNCRYPGTMIEFTLSICDPS